MRQKDKPKRDTTRAVQNVTIYTYVLMNQVKETWPGAVADGKHNFSPSPILHDTCSF